MPRLFGYLAVAIAASGLLALPARAGGDVTDLPFFDLPAPPWPGATQTPGNGNGRLVTCSWHNNCILDVDQYPKAGELAIDFRARPAGRWPVTAPGNGTVVTSRSHDDSRGETVEIQHPDGQVTHVYHLDSRFVAEGMPVCRYVTLGFAGSSGRPAPAPHIHFGTKSAPRFAPIRGAGGDAYGEDFFVIPTAAPAATAAPRPVAHHSCSGPCKHSTKAYIVDDILSVDRCPISCALGEFHFPGLPWSGMIGGGFSYTDRDFGTYKYRSIQAGEEPVRRAQFRPDLSNVDPAWTVYAFVPVYNGNPRTHEEVVAPSVKYTVTYFVPAGFFYQQRQEVVAVDQRASGGRWVRIGGTYPTYWPRGTGGLIPQFPLILEVSTEQYGGCAGDRCRGRLALADAALFMPSDCGS